MAIGRGKIVRVTYHSQTKLIVVFEDMTYAWFCNENILRYEEFSDVDFLLFYAYPIYPLCRLQCDDDVKLMFDFFLFFKIKWWLMCWFQMLKMTIRIVLI